MQLRADIKWLLTWALRRIYYSFPAPSYYKSRTVALLMRAMPALRSSAAAFAATPNQDSGSDLPAGDELAAGPEDTSSHCVLVIDQLTPMPDRDSGSVDITFIMKTLQDLGYQVTFAPFDLRPAGRYTAALQREGIACLCGPAVISIRQHLKARGRRYDLVLLYRLEMAHLFLDAVRKHCPRAKVVFDTVDLHFLREARQAVLQDSELLRRCAQLTKRREIEAVRKADCTIVLSQAERALLETEVSGAQLAVIPFLRQIPGPRATFAERGGVLFIGGFQHPPNEDAVRYLLSAIWPLIRRRLGDATLHLIGSAPPPDVAARSGTEGIEVHGQVPDVAPFFERCRVSVSPLRFGAGIKGKIGTSMSYGLPCVATSMAVEGMDLTAETEVLVADHPEDFAAAVARLHTDEALWQRLSANALAFAREHYSLASGRSRLQDLLDRLDRLPQPPAAPPRC